MKIQSRGYGARRRFRISPALITVIVVVLGVGALFATGVIDPKLLGFGSSEPDYSGTIAVPVSAAPIPRYTKLTRDHLWNPRTGTFSSIHLRPNLVSPEMMRSVNAIIGRVLDHDKPPGYVFTEADFFPKGTRPGLVAGIPAGKRAVRVAADKIDGLIGLNPGDRFDLVSTLTIDAGRGSASLGGGIYSQQLDLQARLSNWQKQANVRLVVQNGQVVEPLATRQVPVASNTMTNGMVVRTKPVQEIVIAVEPEEVAHLTEALAVGANVECVPRSGSPDDPVDSVTPGLRPWSPYSGPDGVASRTDDPAQPGVSSPLGAGPLTTIETISGSKREMIATPVKRSEAMLVQMFFFILMLFGIAALTIDMGYVRLTQSLMQNAADTAALEGLRQRDAADDANRRTAAKSMLDRAFIDPAGQRNMGAGPDLTMDTPGEGTAAEDSPADAFNANQHYAVGPSPFYKPGSNGDNPIQYNQNNCVNGDMVAGTYTATPPPPPPAEDIATYHNEGNKPGFSPYSRLDFQPVGPDTTTCPSSPGTAALDAAPSFLVRMRRTIDAGGTYDPQNLDNLGDPNSTGISSSGPTLPMLFGRANVLESIGTHNPRHDGFAVRATAIADVRIALRVGSPVDNPPLPGGTPFALTLDFWNSLSPDIGRQINGHFSALQGTFTSPPLQAVGATVAPPIGLVSCPDVALGYAPIYRSGENRVIGFGAVAFHPTGNCAGFTVTRLGTPVIAPANATAVPGSAFPAGLTLMTQAEGALLAPVLAR